MTEVVRVLQQVDPLVNQLSSLMFVCTLSLHQAASMHTHQEVCLLLDVVFPVHQVANYALRAFLFPQLNLCVLNLSELSVISFEQ